MIEGLKRQIAGEEAELARIEQKAALVGWLNDLICAKTGAELVLEELRAELRDELGEPEPTRH
jgi:hypothetical protein